MWIVNRWGFFRHYIKFHYKIGSTQGSVDSFKLTRMKNLPSHFMAKDLCTQSVRRLIDVAKLKAGRKFQATGNEKR